MFFQKIWLCHAQHDKGFLHHAKITRNLMIQFQENTPKGSTTEGWTDPILQYNSSLLLGVQQVQLQQIGI